MTLLYCCNRNKLIGPKKDLVIKLLRDLKDDSDFVFPDIKVRVASESEIVVPAPVVGPVVTPLPVVVEEAVVAMEEEVVVVNNIEHLDWDVHIERPIRQLEKRIRVLKNNSHCPKCHLICKDLSGGKYKLVNGHTESTKGWGHPNCGTKGAVTKSEAATHMKMFRKTRMIEKIEKMIIRKKKKKKKKK